MKTCNAGRRRAADGGWGESYLSCQDKAYSQLGEGESHCVRALPMLPLLQLPSHPACCIAPALPLPPRPAAQQRRRTTLRPFRAGLICI